MTGLVARARQSRANVAATLGLVIFAATWSVADASPDAAAAQDVARAATSEGAARFHAATNLARQGDPGAATQALVGLALELPLDSFSDDALLEAARLTEGPLGDPMGALLLYRRLLQAYPESRLARRAQARVQDLTRSVGDDGRFADALAELESLRTSAPTLTPSETAHRLQRVIDAHPDLPDGRQALYWLGSVHERMGDDVRALATYALVDGDGDDMWWVRARRARGDLLLARGDADGAREEYDRLAASPHPQALHVGRDALDRLRVISLRRTLARIACGILLAWCAWLAFATARHRRRTGRLGLWPPPIEAWFLLPVAALFVVGSATSNRTLGPAIEWSIAGGLLLTWWSGAVHRHVRNATPHRRSLALLQALGSFLAVLAVLYLAVHTFDLLDYLVETWRHGPER